MDRWMDGWMDGGFFELLICFGRSPRGTDSAVKDLIQNQTMHMNILTVPIQLNQIVSKSGGWLKRACVRRFMMLFMGLL